MKLHSTIVLGLAVFIAGVASQTMDPGLFDTESSGSGMGSAAGSGNGEGSGGEDGESSCVPPQFKPPPNKTFERNIVLEIRCHLACVEKVARNENITFELDRTYPFWPTIPKDVIEEDCITFHKIQECRTGCLEHGLSPGVTISKCKALCSRSCSTACKGEASCEQEGSQCLRICSNEDCEVGCLLYEDQVGLSATSPSMLPPAPVREPHFVIPDDRAHPGLYRVDASDSIQLMSASTQDGGVIATSFLFRVLHAGTSTIAYYWLHTLNDLLDLVSFACDEDVLVQYAAVNKYGISRLSNATIISVYGVLTPTDPELITFTVTPDLRPNFWNHAVIKISWIPPTNISSVSHYNVILHSHSSQCGSLEQIFSVSKNETSAVIQANTPRDGPIGQLGGCIYEVSVFIHLVTEEQVLLAERRRVTVYKSDTIPVPLNFMCDQIWNDQKGTFSFNFSWSIPDFDSWRDAIYRFQIKVYLLPFGEDHPQRIYEIRKMPGRSNYFWNTMSVFPHGAVDSYYRIILETTSIGFLHKFLTPDEMECQFSATPIPPQTIDTVRSSDVVTIDVLKDELGGVMGIVTVLVEWVWQKGSERFFEVRVTENAVYEEADDPGEEFALQRVNVTSTNMSVALMMELPARVENTCVYVQIHSISVFGGVSNWSRPVCIAVGEFVVTMTTDVDATVTTQQSVTAALAVEVLYIIIGISLVMLVAVVIMALCVVMVCLKNRRANKRTASFTNPYTEDHKGSLDSKPEDGESFQMIPLLREDCWELKTGSVVIDNKLGHGAFGDVYQGIVRRSGGETKCEETDSPDLKNVAIKVLKDSSGDLERQSFLDHIEQAKLVTHQITNAGEIGSHVVKMIGCVTSRDPYCLVCELPPKGDLLTYVHSQRTLIVEGHKRVEVTSHMLLNFAEQITIGMEFLSYIGVVHGDLACRNMYLDHGNLLKISDFGLSGSSKSKAKPRAYHRTIDGRLPMRWMALESLEEGQFSSASDVWGYGVTLWEIATLGGFPYSTISHKELVAHLEMGERLERPPNCSQELYNLMSECWIEESYERPTFTDIRVTLQRLQSDHPPSDLLALTIDPKLLYYNVVLASSPSTTPEHPSNDKSEEGGSGNYWRGRDKVADRSYPHTNHLLPSIVEDEQEDLDELMAIKNHHSKQKNLPTHTTQTIVVETYDTESGSTGSINICGGDSKNGSECTVSVSADSASPVSTESSELSEVIEIQQKKSDLSSANLGNEKTENQVICNEIEVCASSTDL